MANTARLMTSMTTTAWRILRIINANMCVLVFPNLGAPNPERMFLSEVGAVF
jgi:hypothetical protein